MSRDDDAGTNDASVSGMDRSSRSAESGLGPASLEKASADHREVLTMPLEPPQKPKRMLLKLKKFVNASGKVFP